MIKLRRIKRKRAAAFAAAILVLLTAAFVTAYAAEGDRVSLPVLMYHSVLADENYLGKYVISPEEFEADLIFLKNNGYESVSLKELCGYVRGENSLPEKPVLLTFDDGYYNNYLYAYPLALKYGANIVISPIGKYADIYSDEPKLSPYYSHATWEQLREMLGSGLVELSNHSYDLHSSNGLRLGVKMLPGEQEESYRNIITEDIEMAEERLERIRGERSLCFAYPFGALSPLTPEIISSLGFEITLSCEEKISTVTRDKDSLLYLGRFLRAHGRTAEKILSA